MTINEKHDWVSTGRDDVGATLMVHQARTLNALGDGDLQTARSAAADGAPRQASNSCATTCAYVMSNTRW